MIERVIAELKANGRTSACVVCPVCGGGRRKRRTLSVDLRDGTWLWLCHRATCNFKGAITHPGDADLKPEPERLVEFTEELRMPELGDPVWDTMELRAPSSEKWALTDCFGLRVLVRDPSTVVWVLKDFSLKRKAVVTRTPDKTIKTYKETPGPVYGYFPASDSYPLVLFEDPWSAALGALDGLDSVALCGATVTRGMALIIADHLKRIDAMGRLVVVVPDPDKAGTEGAAQSVARLEALGLRAARFPVAVDYKDLDPRTRASYAKTIQSLPLPRADGNVL